MRRLRAAGVKRVLSRERAADLLLWVAISLPVLIGDQPIELWLAGFPRLWPQIATVALLGLAVAVGRRHPVPAVAVPAGLGLAATAGLLPDHFVIAQTLLAFLLGRRTSGLRTGLLFFGGVCLAGLLLGLTSLVSLSGWLSLLAGALLTILLPWLAGRYARQHGELVRTGWELAERLERERDLVGERVRLLERSRIAGDMHDSLGHELSLIALRAAALQVDPGLDESARKAAGELRESAAVATERLREIIEVLREDGEPAPVLPSGDTVAALVERAAASGMAVRLEGELVALPPMADRAAYRVVQESLTNATRHAPGAEVTVRLGVDVPAEAALITVTNAAPPAGPLPRAGTNGYGLVGLDERVRLAGGRLLARTVDGGFEVTARLPLAEGAAVAPPDARRELALARRRVRRSVIDAIWMPVAAAAVLLPLILGYDRYLARSSVLDAEVQGQLRIGQSQSSVQALLPAYQVGHPGRPEGAPADPPGTDECRFYRISARSVSPAYRLCFTDGKLSHNDEVTIIQR